MISFTEDQAAALVIDAGTLKRGRELAGPAKWAGLGRTDTAAWGECAGSGSKPYLTGIDLSEPAFKCSCPSRVFPCKHGAGLLLLLARQPALLPAGAPPVWLAEWLEKRQAKGEEQAEKTAAKKASKVPAAEVPAGVDGAAAAAPSAAQLKREAQRHARMQAGAEDLETWLLDLLRAGLADLAQKPASFWENQAGRLVDNQLPGLAAVLRELAELPTAGPHWSSRLLGRLGELYVLVRAFLNRDSLAPTARQDVWQQVGITPKKDELLADPAAVIIADTWLVVGQYAWEEERVTGRRSWLFGQNSGRTALVLEFAFGSQPFATALVPQGKYAGELVFYPGLLPLRAAPINLVFKGSAADATPPGQSISELLESYASALSRQPWLRQWPAALGPVLPTPLPDGRWLLYQAAGATEPLALPLRIMDEEMAWQWLAFSGGQPLTLFGEWDGQAYLPVISWTEDRDKTGTALVLDDFFVAGASAGQPVGALAAAAVDAPSQQELPAAEAPAWPSLLRLALLGTRQSAEALPAFPTLAALPGREQQLLLSAGALAMLRKAGYVPPAASVPPPTPAPADRLPALGPLGTECLHRMLSSAQHLDLLPDYLGRMAAAGRRVPEALLMPLLQHATRSVEVRGHLGAVLGERGHWLAALNPAWAKFVSPNSPTADPADLATWETGQLPERLTWLRQAFAHNADAARTLLLAALPIEPAKVQEALLTILAEHLHPAAEPALETLLKSRGQEVRWQAATLLVRLPGAALTERLWARAAPLLSAKRKLLGLGKATLEVTLPTAWDKTWLADGIEEQNSRFAFSSFDASARKAVGPAAARLANLLALLPPGRWATYLGLTPPELLAAALDSEWAVSLLLSWGQSTLLHRDAAFAAAFLALWLQERSALEKAHCVHGINWVSMAELVPAAEWAPLLTPIEQRIRRREPGWTADLGYLPTPWPRSLTRAVLAAFEHELANTATLPDTSAPHHLRQLAWLLPHTVAACIALPEANEAIRHIEAIPHPHPTFQNQLQEFTEALRFRLNLTASLTE